MPQFTKQMDFICGAQGAVIDLPGGVKFLGARYERQNRDLVLISENRTRVFIRGYFLRHRFPVLRTEDGAQMAGRLILAYMTLSERALVALGAVSRP